MHCKKHPVVQIPKTCFKGVWIFVRFRPKRLWSRKLHRVGLQARLYTDVIVAGVQIFSMGSIFFHKICPPFQRNVFSYVLDLVAVGSGWLVGWLDQWMGGWVGELTIVLCRTEATWLIFLMTGNKDGRRTTAALCKMELRVETFNLFLWLQ